MEKWLPRCAFVLSASLPAFALAAGSFDGVWKTRRDSVRLKGHPDIYVLANGSFRCVSCLPKINIAADGGDQRVQGHSYYDTVAVRVVNPSSILLTEKLRGRLSATITQTVSMDGTTLTLGFTDFSSERPITGSLAEQRVGPAAFPGTHAISGSWLAADLVLPDLSPQDRFPEEANVHLESAPDGLKASWGGRSFSAHFDGNQYPVAGDPAQGTISLGRTAANVIEETYRCEGRIRSITQLTLADDGGTILVDRTISEQVTATYVMDRQLP